MKFEVHYGDNTVRFKAIGTTNRIMLVSYLSKAFTKTAYCELCGVCEIECPTGALTVRDSIKIDKSKCVHCHNCFEINTKGCIIEQERWYMKEESQWAEQQRRHRESISIQHSD